MIHKESYFYAIVFCTFFKITHYPKIHKFNQAGSIGRKNHGFYQHVHISSVLGWDDALSISTAFTEGY